MGLNKQAMLGKGRERRGRNGKRERAGEVPDK